MIVRESKNDDVYFLRGNNNSAFNELEDTVMSLLRKQKTKHVVSALLEAFYPIWDYYINYYLYVFGMYDGHPDRAEHYQESYLFCVNLVAGVNYNKNDFNRIKHYFNKSIYGNMFNRLYKKPKRDIQVTKDEMIMNIQPDRHDQFTELEVRVDLSKASAHVEREFDNYFELLIALHGEEIYKLKDFYWRKFKQAVFTAYYSIGRLLTGEEFFIERYGNVFLNEV